MLVLVVDTAGTAGGVLLAGVEDRENDPGHATVLGFCELPSREFSTQLITAVAGLFDGNSCRLADVDVLGVVSGPGSFTGLRVGLSAVKAFAEAASKPIVAVSRLAVMASVAADGEAAEADPVHAVLDAGRGEFYHGAYRDFGWTCIFQSLQNLESLRNSLERLPGPLIASEPAVIGALHSFSPRVLSVVGAREALPLVLRGWRAGRVTDVVTLDVNYLRASDAEILARLAIHTQQRNPEAMQPCHE